VFLHERLLVSLELLWERRPGGRLDSGTSPPRIGADERRAHGRRVVHDDPGPFRGNGSRRQVGPLEPRTVRPTCTLPAACTDRRGRSRIHATGGRALASHRVHASTRVRRSVHAFALRGSSERHGRTSRAAPADDAGTSVRWSPASTDVGALSVRHGTFRARFARSRSIRVLVSTDATGARSSARSFRERRTSRRR